MNVPATSWSSYNLILILIFKVFAFSDDFESVFFLELSIKRFKLISKYVI